MSPENVPKSVYCQSKNKYRLSSKFNFYTSFFNDRRFIVYICGIIIIILKWSRENTKMILTDNPLILTYRWTSLGDEKQFS